jgi:hypothetical protein
MVKDKLILTATSTPDSGTDLAQEMVRLLYESLESDREAYLRECYARLEKVTSERDLLEREFRRLRHSHRLRVHKITVENEELRRQYQTLESTVDTAQWQKTKYDQKLKESLARQEEAIAGLLSVLTSASSTQMFLKQNVSELRSDVIELQNRQIRMIHRARKMCMGVVKQSVRTMAKRVRKGREEEIEELQSQINAEKGEQKRIRGICESMIEDIWALAPKEMKTPKIGVEEFPRRVGEVCQFVDEIVESERRKAESAVKAKIQAEIPEIEMAEGLENLSDVIERYVSEKVAARERECEALLQKGIEREKRLRAKLSVALKRIQELQTETQSKDNAVFDEVPQKQEAWLEQKRALDETMEALARERESSSSYLNHSSPAWKGADSNSDME